MGAVPRIIVAGTHSGVGKTTITIGVIRALRSRGLTVQAFKTGPDYIDPGFHSIAAARVCRNLDTMLLDRDTTLELFDRGSRGADLCVIEGVMGLYDGAAADDERGSAAHLAKLLGVPVILVVDARSMARSAAAVVLGFDSFEPGPGLAGVIFNRVGSPRHFAIVRDAVLARTRVPVLGYVEREREEILPERHLGLVPAWEGSSGKERIERIAAMVNRHLDVDGILRCARTAGELPNYTPRVYVRPRASGRTRIGYAFDEAFHFYYRDNLEILEHLGAELVPFSPRVDPSLPEGLGALYIGGGFPELHAPELAGNTSLLADLRSRVDAGLPVYAECGGLMYLSERLVTSDGAGYTMVGVIPGEVRMDRRLRALGYCEAELLTDTVIGVAGTRVRGHVFHWSYATELPPEVQSAYCLSKGDTTSVEGVATANVLAGYLHVHFASCPDAPRRFIAMARAFLNQEEAQ